MLILVIVVQYACTLYYELTTSCSLFPPLFQCYPVQSAVLLPPSPVTPAGSTHDRPGAHQESPRYQRGT